MRFSWLVPSACALLMSCSEGEPSAEGPVELQTISCRDQVIDASATLCTRVFASRSFRTSEQDAIFSQLPASRTPCAAKAREVAEQTINRVLTGSAPLNPMDLVEKCGAAARTQIRLHCEFSCEVPLAAPQSRTSLRAPGASQEEAAAAAARAELAKRAAEEAAAEAAAVSSGVDTPAQSQNGFGADSFPMKDAYRFHTATIQTISGVGSTNARMTGMVTREDATLYCEADSDGEAASAGLTRCIEGVLRRENGRVYSASADCRLRRVTAPWGRSYLEVAAGTWRDAESGENPEESGMASGYASIDPIWQRLCGQ